MGCEEQLVQSGEGQRTEKSQRKQSLSRVGGSRMRSKDKIAVEAEDVENYGG